MEVLVKQKGVALRENTASYEQTMKLQTALQTAQVEKELLKAQHDVAVGERDKMVEENVKLRTKVERMVQQRQKDANDLSYMKLLKEKAVQEVGDLRKMSENQQREKSIIEQELGVVKDHLRSAIKSVSFSVPSSESVVKDMETLVGRLMTAESEKKALFRVLFDHDIIPHTEAMRRAEKLVSDRDGLLDEIKELQHTASKEKEDRILELKHKIEDLMMERDRLMGQCKTLTKENGTLKYGGGGGWEGLGKRRGRDREEGKGWGREGEGLGKRQGIGEGLGKDWGREGEGLGKRRRGTGEGTRKRERKHIH